MSGNENRRETGARKYAAKQDPDAAADVSQDAAENKKPKDGMGLSKPVDETNEKTRLSDGPQPARVTPSPATQKVSGAGPAITERSKDAKAPKAGRQPGAKAKD